MFKKIIHIIFMVTILFTSSCSTIQAAPLVQGEDKPIYTLADGMNGVVLQDNRADERHAVGTLSQLLSIYLVYQAIHNGNLTRDEVVPISDRAFALSQDYNIANVPLRQDGNYTVQELLEIAVTGSGHGAVLALAERLGESEEQFVQQMTQQLDAWGIKDYQIINATGRPSGFEPKQGMKAELEGTNQLTSEGLATIAYHLLSLEPQMVELTRKEKVTFRSGTADAFDYRNPLMAQGHLYQQKLDGLRIASQSMADEKYQYSAVVTAQQGDLRVIGVLLNIPDDQFERLGNQLMTEIAGQYQLEMLAKKGDPVIQVDALESLGVDRYPAIHYAENFVAVIQQADTISQLAYQFKPKDGMLTDEGILIAPLSAEEMIGTVQVTVRDQRTNEPRQHKLLPSAKGNQAVVQVATDNPKASAVKRLYRRMSTGIDQVAGGVWRFFNRIFGR